MRVDQREWIPVHADFRRDKKRALGVRQRNVVQDHLAIDRAADASDIDFQTIFELESGNLVGNEAFARPGVQKQQQCRDQHHYRTDRNRAPLRNGPAKTTALRRLGRSLYLRRKGGVHVRRGLGRRVLTHQKACPIET